MKAPTYASAERLRRKFVEDARRDFLDTVQAELAGAADEGEREAIRAVAHEAAGELTKDAQRNADGVNPEYTSLVFDVNELIDGPEPIRLWDNDSVDPVTGARGRFIDIETLAAENPLFSKVAAAVRNASTAQEAREVVQAALQADYDAMQGSVYDAVELTWSVNEALLLNALLDDVVDDGTVAAADARAEAAAAAELAAEQEAATMPQFVSSMLDAEVARAESEAGPVEVSA